MSEVSKSQGIARTTDDSIENHVRISKKSETEQPILLKDNVIRLGRISAFGPSLDGGFDISD